MLKSIWTGSSFARRDALMVATERKRFQFEGFSLDTVRGCLLAGEREIALRPKSFELLRHLVENAGRLVSKDELIEAVWRRAVVTDDSLASCISDVRSALDDKRQTIIRTLRGRGYLFAAAVTTPPPINGQPERGVSPANASSGTQTMFSEANVSQATAPWNNSSLPPQASARMPRDPLGGPKGQTREETSIAVLPFLSMGDDPQLIRLARAITLEATGVIENLRPIAETIAEVSAKSIAIRLVHAEDDPSVVLKGSIRMFGKNIRVTGQLVDVRSGRSLWADYFDRPADEDYQKLPDQIRRLFAPAVGSAMAMLGSPNDDRTKRFATEIRVAQRRQISVLSCEWTRHPGSDANLDPEDMGEAIAAFQAATSSVAHQYKALLGHYLGASVRAYFGYPVAHEHDAEQAILAGLALCKKFQSMDSDGRFDLTFRVGVSTGHVIVDDIADPKEAQESGVIGDTPSNATRLQSYAEPGTVAIDAGTRQLIGNLFHCRRLEATEPAVWRVVSGSAIPSRFEALRAPILSPIVGREEEVEMLRRRWRQTVSGEGRVILITGEAGIGKSRIVSSLLEATAEDPHTRLRYFCSPQHLDSPLHPIIGQLERASRISRDNSLTSNLDKLDAVLERSGTSRLDAALLSEMLALPNDGRYPILELSPQMRRQKTLEALTSQVETLSRRKPVLTIFEDAHWSDPTSLEVLGRLVDKVPRLPVMIIVTFRSEFNAPWIARHYVTAVTVNRLGEKEMGELINYVASGRPLTPAVRRNIVDRADGIPLFVEEMTKSLIEAGDALPAGLSTSKSSAPSPVPASLHASLTARLDRLGPAKGIAQIGAAIGSEFSYALLADIAREPDKSLISELNRLVEAGLLFQQGEPPHASYFFKHALVQDAAYDALLREPRRAIHGRIVEALERGFANFAERQPEVLARHCAEAGSYEKAARLWSKAGQRSLARSALREAEAQLARALSLLETLSSDASVRRLQIDTQVAFANAVMQIDGFAAARTKATLERASALIEHAEALGERVEDPLAPYSVLYGFWIVNFVAFNGDAAHALATQILKMAQRQKADVPLMIGHRLLGNSCLLMGELSTGRRHLDFAHDHYDFEQHRRLASQFGQDIMVGTLAWRSLNLWLLGHADAARADIERAQSVSRDINHIVSLIVALTVTTMTRIQCGDLAAAKSQIDRAVALATETGAQLWIAVGLMLQRSFALTGDAAQAVSSFDTLLPAYRATGATVVLPFFLMDLAQAYAELGEVDEAIKRLGAARAAADETGECWCDPEIQRIAGDLALTEKKRGESAAERNYRNAIEKAHSQGARSWELRASISLAILLRNQGRRRAAHDLLGPLIATLGLEGDTADLRRAKDILAQLN
jgi:DNA-binding winged helix-turn-helix (wHTH) protein/TolB-like protein/class 3 adenylate cyclase/predicted ATPase